MVSSKLHPGMAFCRAGRGMIESADKKPFDSFAYHRRDDGGRAIIAVQGSTRTAHVFDAGTLSETGRLPLPPTRTSRQCYLIPSPPSGDLLLAVMCLRRAPDVAVLSDHGTTT